jgi:glycine/D-amino acid oxidase-like deaminating enzyme
VRVTGLHTRHHGRELNVKAHSVAVQHAGTTRNTATVDPVRLSRALLASAQQLAGTTVVHGTVCGLECAAQQARFAVGGSKRPAVTGVKLTDGSVLRAKHVVVAMGAWSSQAGGWAGDRLPIAPAQKWQSCELESKAEVRRACYQLPDVAITPDRGRRRRSYSSAHITRRTCLCRHGHAAVFHAHAHHVMP